MMRWGIFDLDGTLFNPEARRHYAALAKENRIPAARAVLWDKFHAEHTNDPPYHTEVLLVQLWEAAGNGVIYLTGRPDNHRASTELQIAQTGLPLGNYLFMRPAGISSDTVEYKRRMAQVILSKIIRPPDHVALVLEDDDRLVQMWREEFGFTCLQPRKF